jgi:adenylate cyclase
MSSFSIVVHQRGGKAELFEFVKPTITIGRADTNDLVLPNKGVSRVHAQIDFEKGLAPRITDLQSANGIIINGQTASGPTEILAEDIVLIGPYKLVCGPAVPRTTERASRPEAFRIEQSPVELNELQKQPGLVQIPDSPIELSQLELLHEVSVRLARTESVVDVTETAVALLFKIAGVHRATLMSWDENRQEVHQGEVRARTGSIDALEQVFDPRKLVLSRTILNKVSQENRPLHLRDARAEVGFAESDSIVRAGIQAAFCSPLTFQGRMMGVLYADNLETANAFSEADFRLFTTIAAQTGMALASAISRGELRKRDVEQAAMRLYIPPQIVDKIEATGGEVELGGLMQPVTVLFADIRGFSGISERMDAREVVSMLNEFFTAMTDVIINCGGTLDKYIGDCVMALFGAPVPASDDAERAVRAAVAMQRRVVELSRSRVGRGLAEIQIGIGVHTGHAVVGNIGSTQRMQYTAIGDTVNLAARLVSHAASGQIVISSACFSSVSGSSLCESLGDVQFKGFDRKRDIYSVLWR